MSHVLQMAPKAYVSSGAIYHLQIAQWSIKLIKECAEELTYILFFQMTKIFGAGLCTMTSIQFQLLLT